MVHSLKSHPYDMDPSLFLVFKGSSEIYGYIFKMSDNSEQQYQNNIEQVYKTDLLLTRKRKSICSCLGATLLSPLIRSARRRLPHVHTCCSCRCPTIILELYLDCLRRVSAACSNARPWRFTIISRHASEPQITD